MNRSLFALVYDVVDDYLERRSQFREEHLGLAAKWNARGDLLYGGALGEPVDQALLIFRVNSANEVEGFVQQDPYVTNGLVRHWQIKKWHVVIGN